jgi:hexosaminidase
VDDMYRRLELVSLRLEDLGSTHLRNKEVLMRRLCNGYDTRVLETLVDVIEPLKIYQRNQGDTMYNVFSPYTKLADVATPDQKVAREFRNRVNQFVANNDRSQEADILMYLTLWKNNHTRLLELIRKSPVLKEAEILSENLAKISGIGIEAMGFIRDKRIPPAEWKKNALVVLEKAKEQGGRCDLQVVSAIAQLVEKVGH